MAVRVAGKKQIGCRLIVGPYPCPSYTRLRMCDMGRPSVGTRILVGFNTGVSVLLGETRENSAGLRVRGAMQRRCEWLPERLLG